MGWVTNSIFLGLHTARAADIGFGKMQKQESLMVQSNRAMSGQGVDFGQAKQTEMDIAHLDVMDQANGAIRDNTKKNAKR